MASLANQSFSMFPSQNDDGFSRYPEPPHSATTSPMDMSSMYSMPTSMAFEPSLYAETSHYTLGNGQTSPGMWPEEGDIRMPSSSLSTASATSSAIGSPQSNPGQSGPAQDWNHQGMGVHPSIVGNDFSPEYGYSYHMEEQPTFDYAHANKGFVGKLTDFFSLPLCPTFAPLAWWRESWMCHGHPRLVEIDDAFLCCPGVARTVSVCSPVTSSVFYTRLLLRLVCAP